MGRVLRHWPTADFAEGSAELPNLGEGMLAAPGELLGKPDANLFGLSLEHSSNAATIASHWKCGDALKMTCACIQ